MEEAIVRIEELSYTYGSRTAPTLSRISFAIRPGEFVLITGPTGCGKSTLLKTLNGLIPHESGGKMSGKVYIGGNDTRKVKVAELSRTVGIVFQSPDDQIFSASVGDETAFVLENMALPAGEIRARVAAALAMVGLSGKERTSIHALSGGQKQRLAVAAVLAARPGVLALDEPISQLDPGGAESLLAVLNDLNRTYGITIVIVEHRIHEVIRLCRRVILMNGGKIAWDGPAEAAHGCPDLFRRHGLRLPQPVDIASRLALDPPATCVEEAVAAIRRAFPALSLNNGRSAGKAKAVIPRQPETVRIRDLCFRYRQDQLPALENVSLSIRKGEIVALMGTNGAGKSTLLHTICGLLRPDSGEVTVMGSVSSVGDGQSGMVLQNPDLMLFNRTVAAEILFGPGEQQKNRRQAERQLAVLLEKLALADLAEEFPLSLSRGQRLRVAIAAALACEPAVLLLDEPTTGQDIARIGDLLKVIADYTAAGGTVVLCTHDSEVAAQIADRVVVMHGGRIIADGHPREVFVQAGLLAQAGLKTPPAVQISCALGIEILTSVEGVVDYVRQAGLGSSAG